MTRSAPRRPAYPPALTLTLLALLILLGFGRATAPATAAAGSRTFPETGKTVYGKF